MKRLLAATDLSSRSDRAVRRSAELARVLGAQLFLLHFVEDDLPTGVRGAGRQEATIQLLEQTLSLPGVNDIDPRILVRAGGLSDSLVHAAETGGRTSSQWASPAASRCGPCSSVRPSSASCGRGPFQS